MKLKDFFKFNITNTVIALFFVLTFAFNELYGQTPSPIPLPVEKSEEEKRLEEEEKRILDLKKDIAEAQKNELTPKFPATKSPFLVGVTEVNDSAAIEAQMIAYAAMSKSANRIVGGIKAIKDKDGKPVSVSHLAILNESDVNLLLGYQVAKNQIEIIRKGYCDVLKTNQTDAQRGAYNCASVTPLTIARSFLGAFIDLTALLKTNVEIKENTFDIDERQLAAEVFRAGRRNDGFGAGVNLYYPKMFPPDINPNAKSSILTTLEAVNNVRARVDRIIGEINEKSKEVEESKGKIKNLKNSIKQNGQQKIDLETKKTSFLQAYCPRQLRMRTLLDSGNSPCEQMPIQVRESFFEISDEIKKLNDCETKLTNDLAIEQTNTANVEKQLEDLLNNVKLNESTAIAPNKFSIKGALAQLKVLNTQFDKFIESLISTNTLSVNALTNFIKAENLKNALPARSYWLQLKVLKAGVDNSIKANLISDMFTRENRLSHGGRVIVQYILFDEKGKSVASDTVTEYF